MRPDRIVVGADDDRGQRTCMRALYAPFNRNHDRLIVMDVRSAELTKYAANAMLATRISFMNELANLAEKLGADIEQVRQGIGSDPRIGYHFLYAGCGYGGSLLPQGRAGPGPHRAANIGMTPAACSTPSKRSTTTRSTCSSTRSSRHFGHDLQGRPFALWGLAFKPNTVVLRPRKGRVTVSILSPEGREVVLSTLSAGDHFGEMALLDDAPRSATVTAAERSELAVVTREAFFELLKGNFVLIRGAPLDLLAAAPPRQRDDRGARLPRREGAAGPLLPRPRRRAGTEGGGRLDRRRPPVAARDRRHDRLEPRDRLPHDVAAVAREPDRPEGEGHLRPLRGGDRPPAAETRWSSAPGPSRTS